MKASIVDLRYKMKKVLKALDRGEEVKVLYHGKVKGIIHPQQKKTDKRVKDHAFFGMHRTRTKPVLEEMKELRGTRHNDL